MPCVPSGLPDLPGSIGDLLPQYPVTAVGTIGLPVRDKSARVGAVSAPVVPAADVIVRRWQDWTGKAPVREADGVAFDDLAAQRDSA
jgi:hypothetical protein